MKSAPGWLRHTRQFTGTGVGIIVKSNKRTEIHKFNDVLLCVAVVVAQSPYRVAC